MPRRRSIEEWISQQSVVVFMKGTPLHPMCAGSARAVEVLNEAGIAFQPVDVQQDPFLRARLPGYANWPELPQVYLQGDLIGGWEVLVDLQQSGELERMAEELGEVNA